MTRKSSLVLRGKASSTWRNNKPPNNEKINTVKVNVPISFSIPVGKIFLCAIVFGILAWIVL